MKRRFQASAAALLAVLICALVLGSVYTDPRRSGLLWPLCWMVQQCVACLCVVALCALLKLKTLNLNVEKTVTLKLNEGAEDEKEHA